MSTRDKAPLKTETNPSASAVERRQEIVRRSAQLFDEVGYHQASMGDIADAVGLAKPSLYHYFRGKDSILLGVHDEVITRLTESLDVYEADASVGFAEKIRRVMFDIVDLLRSHPGYVRVYFEHHRELPEDALARAREERRTYHFRVRRIFELGAEDGVFRGDAEMASIALFSICNNAYQWWGIEAKFTPQEFVDRMYPLLADGMVAR